MTTTTMTYLQAITDGLREAMRADERIFLLGEDIGAFGGAFKATYGLYEEFGADRVQDTPIAETAIIGSSVGAALAGLRPVWLTPATDARFGIPAGLSAADRLAWTGRADGAPWTRVHDGVPATDARAAEDPDVGDAAVPMDQELDFGLERAAVRRGEAEDDLPDNVRQIRREGELYPPDVDVRDVGSLRLALDRIVFRGLADDRVGAVGLRADDEVDVVVRNREAVR